MASLYGKNSNYIEKCEAKENAKKKKKGHRFKNIFTMEDYGIIQKLKKKLKFIETETYSGGIKLSLLKDANYQN